MPKLSLAYPRFSGLQRQFLLLIVGIYLLTGTVALTLFGWGIRSVTRQLGEEFAAQYALRQKDRLLAPIQHELALSRHLVDSPLLKRWARNEEDPVLKAEALDELDHHRRHFADHSFFFVVGPSGHYYHNNAADEYRGRELRYTLDAAKPEDQWYFATLAKVSDFDLNVDYDAPLNVTKVWINVLVKDGAEKLGLGGTGLELDGFVKAVLSEDRPGISTLLLDRAGSIKAHQDRAYIDLNTVAKNDDQRRTFYPLLASPQEQTALREQMEQVSTEQRPVVVLPLTVGNQPYLVAITYLAEIKWFVVTLVDTAYIYSVWRFMPFAALLAISLLTLAIAVAVLLRRLVLNPLTRLRQSTQAVAAGNYAQLATVETRNEIGELTDDFNAMTLTIRQYTGHLETLVDERTHELQQAHRELADTHQQVVDSIQYAQLLQQAMLPTTEMLAQALTDYFIIWQPRDRVGGDFYYCRIDQQGCLLALVDCTGHGVPGAFMTMAVNAALNHIASTIGLANPVRVLQALHRDMQTVLHQRDLGEGFENGLDAGVCYWGWDQPQLQFAGARIDLCYQDAVTPATVLRGNRVSLGYRHTHPDWTLFRLESVERIPDRIFYLTTDGLLDQSGGLKGHGFSRRQFQDVLRHCNGQALPEQQAALEQALVAWRNGRPQRDDITVIGFRPRPGATINREKTRHEYA
jgi:serine phosphatase RsbU (regulator of sigma subunit)